MPAHGLPYAIRVGLGATFHRPAERGGVAVCGMPGRAQWAVDRRGESGLLVTASATPALWDSSPRDGIRSPWLMILPLIACFVAVVIANLDELGLILTADHQDTRGRVLRGGVPPGAHVWRKSSRSNPGPPPTRLSARSRMPRDVSVR